MPPVDCPTHCGPTRVQLGLQAPPPPSGLVGRISGYFGQPPRFPLLADIKRYLTAIANAGRFFIDAPGQVPQLGYTFVCQFRPGTRLFHGTTTDFTDLDRRRVFRGAFYTSWLAYARFLLWKTLSAAGNQDAPASAVILEYDAPAGDLLFVNSRLYTGQLIADARDRHGIADAHTYLDNQFSQARNFAQHAKIFCNSAVNYGVTTLVGAIQGIGATDLEVGGMLEPFLAAGPRPATDLPQRQRNFRLLCQDIGGPRGAALQVSWSRAVPHLIATNQATLAQFEELYWNDRPLPRRHRALHIAPEVAPRRPPLRRTGSHPDLRVAAPLAAAGRAGPLDRLAEYRSALLELARGDHPGHQYCFDYRTYGPLVTTADGHGNPNPISARSCLTALYRTRQQLGAQCDTILDRLHDDHCRNNGYRRGLYVALRALVDQSSLRALTGPEIEDVRRAARLLDAQLV